MNWPIWLILIGVVVIFAGGFYDKRYGRPEEYGPLIICVAGAIVVFVGSLCLFWRWMSVIFS